VPITGGPRAARGSAGRPGIDGPSDPGWVPGQEPAAESDRQPAASIRVRGRGRTHLGDPERWVRVEKCGRPHISRVTGAIFYYLPWADEGIERLSPGVADSRLPRAGLVAIGTAGGFPGRAALHHGRRPVDTQQVRSSYEPLRTPDRPSGLPGPAVVLRPPSSSARSWARLLVVAVPAGVDGRRGSSYLRLRLGRVITGLVAIAPAVAGPRVLP
jgi:hypothetical protein